MITLRDWQKKAINNLKSTLGGGVVEAGTGTGKTVLGLQFIAENPTSKFLIVVPTIVLMDQWKDEIVSTFKLASKDEISLIGGGYRNVPDKRITIAVINSLRGINWSHPLAKFDFAVFDEVHRYASDENIKPLASANLGYKIGLTATLRRSDGKEKILTKLIGPVVYKIGKDQAIDEGYICDYTVHPVACQMTTQEAAQYVSVDSQVKEHMKLFNNNFKSIQAAMKMGPRGVMYRYAITAMKGIQDRKSLAVKVTSKVDKAVELCKMYKDNKVIVFDELQESANKIYNRLKADGIPCVMYHSGILKKEKKISIQKYIDNEVNIMISVRALDEGLNVKNTDVGIVVNGNSQERQILQRLGRLLRMKDDKVAKIFMLFTPGTVDERYMHERMKYIGKQEDINDQFDN